MLDEKGQPHLLDFGLAVRAEQSDRLTHAGGIVGTPAYMAPEQAQGQSGEPQPASDQYSLGVVLYEMLCGQTPFHGPPALVLSKVIHQEPASPRSLRADVPADLETICLKALAKRPQERYPSCQELADDLRRWLDGEPILARRQTLQERLRRWCRRQPRLVALGGVVVVCLVVAAVLGNLGAASLARSRATIAVLGQKAQDKALEASQAAEQIVRQAQLAQEVADRQIEAQQTATDAAEQANQAQQKTAAQTAALEKARLQAQEREREGRQQLYRAHLQLARQALDRSDLGQARLWLDRQHPLPGQTDLRDASWHELQEELLRGAEQTPNLLRGHRAAVLSVCFSPDGKRIASASADKTIKLWDAGTGTKIRSLSDHTEGVLCVAYSPDGKRLVSASADQTLKIWDAGTGQPVHTLKGHTGAVASVAYSPDGKRLVSGGGEILKPGQLKVWDAERGLEVFPLKGHTDKILCVAYSPDGKRLVSASADGNLKVWNSETGQEVLTIKGQGVTGICVAFSPDGKRLASASAERPLKVWNAETGQQVFILREHTGAVTGVSFSPDGKRLVSASADRTLKVWNVETGEEVFTLKGHTDSVTGVAFGPDGKRLVSASADRTLKVWNVGEWQGDLLLLGYTGVVSFVAFSPAGKRIAIASAGNTVKVWDAAKGIEVLSLKGHTNVVTSVAYSPDGKRIITGSWDKTVKVWDADKGTEIRSLEGHTDSVSSVAFSLDGKRIVSGSWDKTVKIWDADKGVVVRSLDGHIDRISSAAFSLDGKWIISGSRDKTVKVWDADKGAEVLSRKAHPESVDRLLKHCGDKDPGVRIRAVMVLKDMTIQPADVSRVVQTLTTKLEQQSQVRYYAALGLARFGKDGKRAIGNLIRLAEDPVTFEVRWAALSALAAIGKSAQGPDPRAVAAMIKASHDVAIKVRLEAAKGLGMLGKTNNPQLAPLVEKTLVNLSRDRDQRVVIWANVSAMTLDKVEDARVRAIADQLRAPEITVRITPARGLAAVGPQARPVLPRLLNALNDKDPTVAAATLTAIVSIGDKGPDVLKALNDLHDKKEVPEMVRLTAQRAIDSLTQPRPNN